VVARTPSPATPRSIHMAAPHRLASRTPSPVAYSWEGRQHSAYNVAPAGWDAVCGHRTMMHAPTMPPMPPSTALHGMLSYMPSAPCHAAPCWIPAIDGTSVQEYAVLSTVAPVGWEQTPRDPSCLFPTKTHAEVSTEKPLDAEGLFQDLQGRTGHAGSVQGGHRAPFRQSHHRMDLPTLLYHPGNMLDEGALLGRATPHGNATRATENAFKAMTRVQPQVSVTGARGTHYTFDGIGCERQTGPPSIAAEFSVHPDGIVAPTDEAQSGMQCQAPQIGQTHVLNLENALVEPVLGSPEFPTLGSAKHHLGICKPCAFSNAIGCGSGVECKFCHLCEPGEKKRRRKERTAGRRMQRQWQNNGRPQGWEEPGWEIHTPPSV